MTIDCDRDIKRTAEIIENNCGLVCHWKPGRTSHRAAFINEQPHGQFGWISWQPAPLEVSAVSVLKVPWFQPPSTYQMIQLVAVPFLIENFTERLLQPSGDV